MMLAKKRRLGNKFQTGISNIQIMVTVLIGAILISGSVGMLRAIDQAKVDNDLRDLIDYKQKTRSWWAQHGTFADTTQSDLVANNFFMQTDMTGSAPNVVVNNRWGGVVTVSMAGIYYAGDSLRFDYNNVPARACKQLGMSAGAAADGVMVNGTWVKLTPAAGGNGLANEPNLISLCDAGNGFSTLSYFLTRF